MDVPELAGGVIDVMLVKDAARQAAASTLEGYWTDGFPVDPYVIARRLGIKVQEGSLPDGVSGFIRKVVNEDAQIFVEASDSEVRKRFTVAHEIGHYIERMEIQDKPDEDFGFVDRRDGKTDAHEFFANEYAGELLAPVDVLTSAFEAYGRDVIKTAAHFGISLVATKTRLFKAGLLT